MRLILLIFCVICVQLAWSQTRVHVGLRYGYWGKQGQLNGVLNESSRFDDIEAHIGADRTRARDSSQRWSAELTYSTFYIQLESKEIEFFPNVFSFHLLRFGSSGPGLNLKWYKRFHRDWEFFAGAGMRYYTPTYEMHNWSGRITDMDTAKYASFAYGSSSFNTGWSHHTFNFGPVTGIRYCIFPRLMATVDGEVWFRKYTGIREELFATAFNKQGGATTIVLSQSYSIPLWFVHVGLQYFLQRKKRVDFNRK